jgi:DNA invertase Pin-like site-specific DNA recombinase
LLKPLHETNKIIENHLEEIIDLYKNGVSLRILAKQFGVNRKRLITHIPDEAKRAKNEWFKLRKREDNPKNIPIICITT